MDNVLEFREISLVEKISVVIINYPSSIINYFLRFLFHQIVKYG